MNNAQTTQTPTVLREDESLRTECSRHYILENGARKAVFTAPQATEAGIAPQSAVLPDIDVGGGEPLYTLINQKYIRTNPDEEFVGAGTVSNDYLRVMRSATEIYEGRYTFNREVIGLPVNQIISVSMTLIPCGTVSDTDSVTLKIDGKECVYTGAQPLTRDITETFCATDSYVTVKMVSDDCERRFEKYPLLEIVYASVTKEICHRTFSGIEGTNVQLNVLTGLATVMFDDITDPALGITVSHIFRPGIARTTYGKYFRLNFDETLVKKQGDDTGYLYTDPTGEMHTFNRYVYELISGVKYDLSKEKVDTVTADAEGHLWKGSTEVYAEWRTPQGLTATARLDGIKNVEYFEQRQDKEKQLAEQMRAYREALCRYRVASKADGEDMGGIQGGLLNNVNTLKKFYDYAKVEGRLLFASKEELFSYCSLLQQKKEKEQLLEPGNATELKEDEKTRILQSIALLDAQITTMQSKSVKNLSDLKIMYTEYSALSAQYESFMRQMPVAYLLGEDEIRGFNEKGQLVVVQNANGRGILLEYEVCTTEGDTRMAALCDLEGNRKVRFLYGSDGKLSDIENSVGDICHFMYYGDDTLDKVFRTGKPALRITYNTKGTRITSVCTQNEASKALDETVLTYSGFPETLYGITNRTYISGITHGTVTRSSSAATLSDVTIEHCECADSETVTVTENDAYKQVYVIDNTPCVTQYCEATDNKVTRAEKYTYRDGRIKKIEHLDKSRLYRYTPDTVWTAFLVNQVESFGHDSFGKVTMHEIVEYVSPRTTADTKKAQSRTVNTYGTDRKLHTRTTTEIRYLSGGGSDAKETEERYFYDDGGRMVRKESEVLNRNNGTAVEEYTYNEDGYRIRTCLYNTKDPSSRFYTEEEVDGQGRPTASWDATGLHKTAYAYTARGAVREETAPDGSRHAYGYLPDGRLGAVTGSTEDGEENSTTRAYTEDVVTELRSGRRTIGYTYDGRRRKTSVTVDGTILAFFAYSGENTNAEKVAYSTPGTDISRTTNLFGEVTQTTRGTSGNTVTYTYDTDHRLTSISNGGSDTITFTYDSEDRLTNAASKYCVEGRYYDNKGRMTGRSLQNGEFASVYSQSYGYTYDEDGNLTRILAESAFGCKPGKPDALGRYTGRTFAMGGVQLVEEESVAYIKHGDHATRLPSVIRYRNAGQGSTAYKYRYDARGNMTEVQQDGSLMCRYTYDTLGRLVREDNVPMGFTHLYTYDAQGNILRRRAYPVTGKPEAELLTDSYTDKVYIYDEHGDRLQSYDGENFVYDMVGNPTTYRGKAATWGDDRRLLSYNGTTFSYDARGNRMAKGDLQMYYDADGNLVYQSDGLYFYYDNTGLYALMGGGNFCFCRKDAMGNIVALLDESGAVVVKYTYDAWGNCRVLNPDGTENTEPTFVGNRNPFRYRGYYFDTETGLYFLKTRYYDPAIGRFMTLDDFAYLDPDHVNGLNLYAYCNNNPVMYVDGDGRIAISVILIGCLIAFAVGSTASAVSQGLQYGWDNISIGQVVVDGLFAAASVALAATGISLIASIGIGAAMGFGQYAIGSAFHGESITLEGAIVAILLGGIGGAISGAGAKNLRSLASVYDNMTGRAAQGVKALITTAQRYGFGSRQMALINNLYGKAIQAAVEQGVRQAFVKGTINIIGMTIVTPLLSSAGNYVLSMF